MDRSLYDYILDQKHHAYRKEVKLEFSPDMTPIERMTYRFEKMCAAETPVILEQEQICYLRTVKNIPDIFTEAERKRVPFPCTDDTGNHRYEGKFRSNRKHHSRLSGGVPQIQHHGGSKIQNAWHDI